MIPLPRKRSTQLKSQTQLSILKFDGATARIMKTRFGVGRVMDGSEVEDGNAVLKKKSCGLKSFYPWKKKTANSFHYLTKKR